MPHRSTASVKRKVGSSRNAVATDSKLPAATSAVVWPCETVILSKSPNRAERRSTSEFVCVSLMMEPSGTRDGAGTTDLLLQLQNAVDQRFSRRRAARHVDVHRHDAVAAAHHGIGIVVITTAV